jgi:hypothetical protein
MTISVTRNGTAVSSEIRFLTCSPWDAQPRITQHEIDGADGDILYYRGRRSASCTLTGYCRYTSANAAILQNLKNGARIGVKADGDSSYRYGICTSLSPAKTQGGLFIQFSMTVVEQ